MLVVQQMRWLTYFQCVPKILQRWTINLHPFCRATFIDVLDKEAVSGYHIAKHFRPGGGDIHRKSTAKMDSYDESHLLDRMRSITGYQFTVEQKRIVMDSESIVQY